MQTSENIYLVRWADATDTIQSAAFPGENGDDSLAKAIFFKERLLLNEANTNIQVLHAGRNALTELWLKNSYKGKQPGVRTSTVHKRHTVRPVRPGQLTTVDEAWVIPQGYVDGDADKHGPKVHIPVSELELTDSRTDAEKRTWFKTYKPANKTCLWQ